MVTSYFVNSALGALAGAFLYRHLGTKSLGTYVTAVTIAATVSGVTDLGLTTLGLRELAVRVPAERARLMRALLGLRTGLMLAGVGVSVVFSALVGYKPVLVTGVALAGCGFLVNSVTGTLALSLASRLRFGLMAANETGRQLLTTGGTIALVGLGAGVLAFITLAIPAGLAMLAIVALLVRGDVPLLPKFDPAEWRRLAREIAPFALSSAIGVIYFRLSVIVMSLAASRAQVSYFGLSFRILEVLILIPGVMIGGAFPIFARSAVNDQERLAYAVSRVFVVSLIVGVWFALTLWIAAPLVIKIMGGSAFSQASDVLRIQGFALGASFVNAVWGMIMISLRLYRQLVLCSLVALAAGSALVIVLATTHGADGAALGTTVTELAGSVLIPFTFIRSHRRIVPPLKEVPRVAFAAGIAALVLLIPDVPIVAKATAVSVVYVVLLFATRVIPDELLLELRMLFTSTRRGAHT